MMTQVTRHTRQRLGHEGGRTWVCVTGPLLCALAVLSLGACAEDKEPGDPAGTSDLVVDLQSLQPSVGSLSPSFHPADQSYTVNVGPATSRVNVTAVTTDARANLRINDQPAVSGQPFGPITLDALSTVVPIVVEAFGVSKGYEITITRQTTPDLQDLRASAGALSPAFDPATLAYTVTTGFGTASTTVTATVVDPTATLRINGNPATSGQPSGSIQLNPGATTIPVVVTAANGQTKTYQVTVIRDNTADLANLQTSAGPIAPAFAPSVTGYTASTGFTTAQATITATAADSTATVAINGQGAQSGQAAGPFPLAVGPNPFSIVVTAGSAGSKIYTLVITRTPADTNNNLADLSVSAGPLNPRFDSSITNYVVNVANSVTSTTVTATVARSASSLTINGNPATSGQPAGPFGLNVGPNLFTVVVTAQSGATRQYQVTINRSANNDANLINLSVSAGPLKPNFGQNTTDYTVTVPFETMSTTVTATVSASTSTLAIDGSPAISGQAFGPIGLAVGTTTIPVVVTAQDGSTKTYAVAITRVGSDNNFLKGLELREEFRGTPVGQPVSLTPAFSGRTVFEYAAQDCCGRITYRLTAAPEDQSATMRYRVNNGGFQALGNNVPSALIEFSCCSENTIVIEVRAQNGQTRDYRLDFQIVD